MARNLFIWITLFVLLLAGCKQAPADPVPAPDHPFTILYSGFGQSESQQQSIRTFLLEACDLDPVFITCSDATQALAALRQDSLQVDVWIGLDNVIAPLIEVDSLFADVHTPQRSGLGTDRSFFAPRKIAAYGYSYFAILYDSQDVPEPPRTCGELQDGAWHESLLLPDARISSLGNGMVQWSNELFGDNGYQQFWRSIKPNVYHITPGWREAFDMLLADEAPLAIGLVSQPWGYHLKDDVARYKAVLPQEGSWLFLEGVAILKKSTYKAEAQKVVNLLFTEEYQSLVTTQGWLFPVDTHIEMISGIHGLKPTGERRIKSSEIAAHNTYWVLRWKKIVLK